VVPIIVGGCSKDGCGGGGGGGGCSGWCAAADCTTCDAGTAGL